MQNHEGLTPAERELETVLAGLKPSVTAVDRDRLMFQAGHASARRGNRLWQGLASSLAIMLLVSILVRPKPAGVEVPSMLVANNVEMARTPQFTPVERQRLETFRHYVRTRQKVLEQGIEALSQPSTDRDPGEETPMTRRSLDEFLSST